MASTVTAASTLLSGRDLRFLLEDWLHVETLTQRQRYAGQSLQDYREVLELAEQIATERFAPHNRAADSDEPHVRDGKVVLLPEVKEALDAFCEAGLVGATMDEAVGGMQLPLVIGSALFSWFQAANVATASYVFLTVAAANLLATVGSVAQASDWVEPMIEGRCFGTMCLSEPQAGSSLADLTTRAEPGADGTYRLFGTKMWISGGDHELSDNIVHLVLAKIPGGPPGVKGISLFIVPRVLVDAEGRPAERNDVVLAALNHKMGHRGTVNTVLGFGEGVHLPGGEPGAAGYLVGRPHHGLAYMFQMMNEARIGVGLAATALGYTAYLKSCRYARERPQGRPVASRDPLDRPVAIVEHADVRRMLLAQKSYVEGALALILYCARLADDVKSLDDEGGRERARLLLDLLTPIAKSWPAQWCLAANDLAIQIHGGYGYSREYDVEQHYRDNRLNLIHEGTQGIQAIDLLGRKVAAQDGAALEVLLDAMRNTVANAATAGGEASELARELEACAWRLAEVSRRLVDETDRALALANATVYLEACGHVVIAWLWLEQFLTADGKAGDFYDGKRQAARYFFRYELPRTSPQLDLLGALDRTTLDMRSEWL
jgi:alkylation response protein AidB-like acyl-CoA dehydrogenase